MTASLARHIELPPAPQPLPATALAVDALTVRRGGVELLRDISFSIPRGRTLGLIGESGAGKSMIGRAIARHLPSGFTVTGGSIALAGTDLLGMPAAAHRELLGRKIAFIPQEPMSALNPAYTIGAQFREHLLRNGCQRSEMRERAIQALAEMRLHNPQDVLDKYPFQLSGGMCQRVLIALAFCTNPELVVADEPTASLDVTTQAHIVRLLRQLQERYSISILFITHQLRLAAHFCHEVAVLYAGEIAEYGVASDVLSGPLHPYSLGLSGANPSFEGQRAPLVSMIGKMPSIDELADLRGCRFVTRCASAVAKCETAVPALLDFGGHLVRCPIPQARPRTEAAPFAAAAAGTADQPILTVEGVSKVFRGGFLKRKAPLVAVNGASLSIHAGEFVGIVGESGSGKSTLARLIMGLEQPSGGAIRLDGEPLEDSAQGWRRRIAAIQYVFQDPNSALNPRRRLHTLVTQPLEAHDRPRAERAAEARRLLADVGLSAGLGGRYPSQLSGGQKQRVNIARALCARPRILVADEIVSGLDASVQAQILTLLQRLRSEYNVALLMISHDLAVVRHLCDRIVVMYRGEIIEAGTTDQVFADPQSQYTRELIAAIPSENASVPWPPEILAP